MKRFRRGLLAGLFVVLGFAAGWLYPIVRLPPLVIGQDAVVADVAPGQVSVSFNPNSGGFIDVSPAAEFTTLFIFYPGGLVRPQAYEWLGVALAPYGVRTLISVFTADLAVTAPNRADRLLPLAAGKRVVLGGHSLGGAMAARYALRRPDAVDGLVLLGAYSAQNDDLSALPLEVLVLAAEHDGLAGLETLRAGMARLPQGARLEVIPGAVHSFFGRYGPQRGDGLPSVTRAAAERRIVEVLGGFFR